MGFPEKTYGIRVGTSWENTHGHLGGLILLTTKETEHKGMRAWTNDAAGIDIGSLKTSPYCGETLADFFAASIGDPEKILVAPKGYGKTLYLKYKAHLIRQKLKGSIPIFPDAASDIEFLKLAVDWKEVFQNLARINEDHWSLLWQFVLILKGLQLTNPDSIEDDYLKTLLSSPNLPIGDILSAVIRDTDNFGYTLSQRLATVRNAFNDGNGSAVIFIDNVDEMFVGLDQDRLFNEPTTKRSTTNFPAISAFDQRYPSTIEAEIAKTNPMMWRAAQVGLLLATREIERSARKLNVFSTLRAEAIFASQHPLALQARSHIIPIKYSRDDLLSIFSWHINLMPEERLVAPNEALPKNKFIGPDPIPHSYVKHSNKPASEDIFDLILRHTDFSPRELIVLGGQVARLSMSDKTSTNKHQNIREAISQGVSILFTSFKENAVPRWLTTADEALKFITSPVLNRSRIDRLPHDAAQFFYANGLLGVAETTGTHNEYRQKFLSPWDNSYASIKANLPDSDFYFLHPWLFDEAKKINPKFQPDQRNIIGHFCLFRPPPPVIVRIAKNANSCLAIWIDEELDGVGASSDQLAMPATFLHVVLFAAQELNSCKISCKQFDAAYAHFRERFPRHSHSKCLDPFRNPSHRAHLRSQLVANFPRLAAHIASTPEAFIFTSSKNVEDATIDIAFLEIENLRYEA